MNHKKGNKKINLPTDQRLALIKSLVINLVEFKMIKTTTLRAKETQKFIEKLITIAKNDTVASRRQVFKMINNKKVVKDIFQLANNYSDKMGGYTRTVKYGLRKGDAAEISILEFVKVV